MIEPDDALALTGAIPSLGENYTRREMHKDFREVFGTERGRRVLGHIHRMAGLTAALTKIDGMTTADNLLMHEGRRALALEIMVHIASVQGDPNQRVIYGGRSRPDRR